MVLFRVAFLGFGVNTLKVSCRFIIRLEPDGRVIHTEKTSMTVIKCTKSGEQHLYITEFAPEMWSSLIHYPGRVVLKFK